MPRKRFIYTEGGKPIPGGPIEVEVSDSRPATIGAHPPPPSDAEKPKQAPKSGDWAEYEP